MCISVNDKKKIFPSYSNSRVSTCGCCSSLWLAFQVPFSLLLYLAAISPMHPKFKIKSMRYVYFVHQLQLLKGPSEGPLIPKEHKKRIQFTVELRDKTLHVDACPVSWWNSIWSVWKCLLHLDRKRENLHDLEHLPNCQVQRGQHHVLSMFSCRKDWCTSQNRWYHEETLL